MSVIGIFTLKTMNLYDWAMSQLLPIGGLRWLSDDEVENFDIMSTTGDGQKGYLLEIDGHAKREDHDKLRVCSCTGKEDDW